MRVAFVTEMTEYLMLGLLEGRRNVFALGHRKLPLTSLSRSWDIVAERNIGDQGFLGA